VEEVNIQLYILKMKNILILSALFASALFSNAQTVSDGLLYTGQDLKEQLVIEA